jgi:hypothetical protein
MLVLILVLLKEKQCKSNGKLLSPLGIRNKKTAALKWVGVNGMNFPKPKSPGTYSQNPINPIYEKIKMYPAH